MNYQNKQIADVAQKLQKEFEELDDKSKILKSSDLKDLYAQIPLLNPRDRASFGKELNHLKDYLQNQVKKSQHNQRVIEPIDVTAPFAENTPSNLRPRLLTSNLGSRHPLTTETEQIVDIFTRMGFEAVESRQLDDEYHMFSSLNFPEGHPARDDYDTFVTTEGL
ncbi:MAG: hypothetical protein IT195_13715, partial [Microthrixaceae bacterium]|nr:hypothetical protein [Microthrixaceae bacterium]